MSAVRRSDRRSLRVAQSSPYSRRTAPAPKKSGWSLGGLLSFLNPLRSRQPAEEEDSDEEFLQEDEESIDDSDELGTGAFPAEALSLRGHQLANNFGHNIHAPPKTPVKVPPPASNNSPPETQASPAKNIETVSNYLTEKAGQPLNEVEVRGLVSLLEESVTEGKPEPFRFSASPSTPARGTTPFFGIPTSSSVPFPSVANGPPSPRKTLTKNPNGVYRWQGGGSARPRNRYQSPAFGASRSTPARLKLASPSPEAPKTDSKRRRVAESAEAPLQQAPFQSTSFSSADPPQPSNAPSIFPTTTPAKTVAANGAFTTPKANGTSAPRLRMSALPPKPSVPANPSPLRQAWSQSDSPPQAAPPHPPKVTKAASFMTELIKEVTPPKKPDLSNPYQTASPVKPSAKKPVTRKTRQASKIPVKEKEKEKERGKDKEREIEKEKEPAPSPQTIIEATVPKGSKRSRPPPDIQKSTRGEDVSASLRRSPRQVSPDTSAVNGTSSSSSAVEEATDEEESQVTKKQKRAGVNGVTRSTPSSWATSSESEKGDVEMFSPSQEPRQPILELSDNSKPATITINGTPASGSKPLFGLKSSAPKEPSKLRFSYQVDKAETTSSTPAPPASSSQSSAAIASSSSSSKPIPKPVPKDPKAQAMAMDMDSLPTYSFVFADSTNAAGPSHVAARKTATALPVSSLPTFDFSDVSTPSSTTTLAPALVLSAYIPPTHAHTPAPTGFNWAAAGMAPPAPPSGASWTCDTCMITNDASADKCAACETPQPGAAPTNTQTGFNWAAAGAKPPPTKSSEGWTCGTCMLLNPASATEKCGICDSPR